MADYTSQEIASCFWGNKHVHWARCLSYDPSGLPKIKRYSFFVQSVGNRRRRAQTSLSPSSDLVLVICMLLWNSLLRAHTVGVELLTCQFKASEYVGLNAEGLKSDNVPFLHAIWGVKTMMIRYSANQQPTSQGSLSIWYSQVEVLGEDYLNNAVIEHVIPANACHRRHSSH